MIQFQLLHPLMTYAHLGFLPGFLDPDDPRPAKEQFNEHYAHGGGWFPFKGFDMETDGTLVSPPSGDPMEPSDPPLAPLAVAKLRGETIYYYDHAWVSIRQPDGSFEVARMD